jgi:hypothetical protein
MRTHTRSPHATAGIATLAAAAVATIACSTAQGQAQAPRSAGAAAATITRSGYSAHDHALDEATIDKVLAVMRAWTPPDPPKPTGTPAEVFDAVMKQAVETSLQTGLYDELARNSTATIDATPALKAAIVGQGLSSREFAEALFAFQVTVLAVDLGDMGKWMGVKDGYKPGPVMTRNMDLVRRMRAAKGEGSVSWLW